MAVEKKKKLGIWFYVAAALALSVAYVAFATDFQLYVKVIITVVLLGAYVFARRGYIYFYTASSLIQTGNTDRALKLLKKAVKANVGEQQRVIAGSAFIQISSDPQAGIDILEKVIAKTKNSQTKNSAIVTVSMGYWRLKDTEKAIETLENLKKTWSDSNLFVNLATYYLESGKIDEAKNLISEGKKKNIVSDGMLDNELWYCIVSENWARAEKLSSLLVDKKQVRFSEAYVHAAQIALHNGDRERALDLLCWAIGKRFSLVSTYSEEYIQILLNGLTNPVTSDMYSALMEKNISAVASGRVFDGFEKGRDYTGPAYKCRAQGSYSLKNGNLSCLDDDDERMPNTDLDEKDGV